MNILTDCEDALSVALPSARAGNQAMAPVFADVLRHLEGLEQPAAYELAAVAHFGAATLDAKGGRHQEAQRRREQAVALVDRATAPGDRLFVLDAIADALMDQGENRKALAYCNRSLEFSRARAGVRGVRLWRAGRCHRRVGFNEAALAQFRQAIPLLRRDPKQPLLAFALLDLGTAGAKSAPREAAEALREAAGLFEAKPDLTNAGIAWINLGIALVHAGEFDEALAAYGKARSLRESDPGATPSQRGNLHNNIAGVYRRQRNFARARAETAQALVLLKPVGGEFYAHALGTLGEICRDEGRAEEALARFVEARALYERLPGGSLESLATKIENEADALATLGRHEEATALRGKVAALRGEWAPPPPIVPTVADEASFEALVTVELDGQNLPDAVYARCDLGELERLLADRLAETGDGEVDGHMTGPETTEIHLVGSNARAIFAAVEPVLRAYPLCEGAEIELRQGETATRFPLGRKSAN